MFLLNLLFGFCTIFFSLKILMQQKNLFLCFMINVLESGSQVSEINRKNTTYFILFLLISIDFRFRL